MTYGLRRGLPFGAERGGRTNVMRALFAAAFAALVFAQAFTLAHALSHDADDEAHQKSCVVCVVKALGDDAAPTAASFVIAPTVLLGLAMVLRALVADDRARPLAVRSRGPPAR